MRNRAHPRHSLVSLLTAVFVVQSSLSAEDLFEDLALSAILSFESKYVYRGVQVGEESFHQSVEVGHPLGPGDFYAGIWSSQDIGGSSSDEVKFYGGYQLALSPIFSVTGGYTYYWYPDDGAVPNRENEPFLGILADLPLQPAIFVFYNFTLEQVLVEASIGHVIELSDRSFLEGGLIVGAAHADDANSDQEPSKPTNRYSYFLTYIDLSYAINELSSASLGIRYSGLEDNGYADNFFWGASISFGY